MGGVVTVVLVLGLLAMLVARSVLVVPPGRSAVVQRLGRFRAVRLPGVVFVVPVLDRIRLVDMTEQRLAVQIEATTEDGVEVTVDTTVFTQVLDPRLALFAVSNYSLAVSTIVRTVVRSILHETTLDQQVGQQRSLGEHVKTQAESLTQKWGVRINHVDVHDIQRKTWSTAPRSKADRRRHALQLLQSEGTLWIATASADGGAHLVPFSFVWDGEHIVSATREESPAVRNVRRTGRARVAVGSFSDVVLIDGDVTVSSPDEIGQETRDRLARGPAFDGRRSAGLVYLRLTPQRVQTWWSMSELAAPTIMRSGRWVD